MVPAVAVGASILHGPGAAFHVYPDSGVVDDNWCGFGVVSSQ
jgi:hypothetical protein